VKTYKKQTVFYNERKIVEVVCMGIIDYVLAVVLGMLGLVICYFVIVGSSYLKQKISDAKNYLPAIGVLPAEGSIVIDSLFDRASDVIAKSAAASVGKLEQLVGKDLREKVKAGTASREDLYTLAGEAFDVVMKTVSPEIITALKESVSDVELYIRNIIETELLKLKSELNRDYNS